MHYHDSKNNAGKKVVSANYNDRHSAEKWLVRDIEEPHDLAKSFKTVFATDISFVPSDSIENGRGCSAVALCKTVIGSNKRQKVNLAGAKKLIYCFGSFYDESTSKMVQKIDTLYLDEAGNIWSDVILLQTSKAASPVKKEEMAMA